MLKSLNIKNFILIDNLNINFDKGFNVITGETGAGKSIIINAIDIALGARATKDVIKTGEDFSTIELTVTNITPKAIELLKSEDIEIYDNEIVISKEISQTSSKSRVNGSIVNSDFMKKLRETIVDIHSQHQTYAYIQPKYHINLLDSYAGNEHKLLLDEYKNIYENYKQTQKDLEAVKNVSLLSEQQLDYLKFQIKEIEDAQLDDFEEDTKLSAELEILLNSETLKEYTYSSYWNLNGEDSNILSGLSSVKMSVQKAAQIDMDLNDIYENLVNAIENIREISTDLRNYSENLSSNLQKIDEIQARQDVLEKIKRKYGNTLEEVCETYEKLSKELNTIDNSKDEEFKLEEKLKSLELSLQNKAKELSISRKNYGQKLSEILTQELENLEMPKVKFEINIENCDFCENGADKVEFMISTNISEDAKPLIKIASGGEISRVMLGIKTIFAKSDTINTIIFDEIDTGISGKASQAVADKIKELANTHQVISITHQPIIAAKAQKHLYVAKDNTTETKINIYDLKDENKIKAIAILAGGEITEESMNFARQLVLN